MTMFPYAFAVGSLMHVMVCIRPEITQEVRVVSKFMNNLGKAHWKDVKWIFRYLRGTSNCCLNCNLITSNCLNKNLNNN